MKVVLVDSGGANIGSVRYALERLGVSAEMTADADTILAADRRGCLNARDSGRFLRLVARSGHASGPWASLAEVDVLTGYK